MKTVTSDKKAMEFFLENPSGQCKCTNGIVECTVNCYPDAVLFFKEFGSPSHSEETDTTESAGKDELKKVFTDIMEYQMSHVQLARTTEPYKLAEKGLELLSLNSHSSLVRRVEEQKEEIERLNEKLGVAKKELGKYAVSTCELLKDNEAKEKRVKELETFLQWVSVASWETHDEQEWNSMQRNARKLLTPPIDTKP